MLWCKKYDSCLQNALRVRASPHGEKLTSQYFGCLLKILWTFHWMTSKAQFENNESYWKDWGDFVVECILSNNQNESCSGWLIDQEWSENVCCACWVCMSKSPLRLNDVRSEDFSHRLVMKNENLARFPFQIKHWGVVARHVGVHFPYLTLYMHTLWCWCCSSICNMVFSLKTRSLICTCQSQLRWK